jgi:hypothetical protein
VLNIKHYTVHIYRTSAFTNFLYGREPEPYHHLIYDCEIFDKEREKLIAHTSREEDWPVRKCELVNKYLKQFSMFVNSIDFEKL